MSEPLDLQASRRICEKATPGPWEATSEEGQDAAGRYRYSVCRDRYDGPQHECVADTHRPTKEQAAADAEFIALARAALPQLLDLVEEARDIIDRVESCEPCTFEEMRTWLARMRE